jgi:hypothetical protein
MIGREPGRHVVVSEDGLQMPYQQVLSEIVDSGQEVAHVVDLG